MTALQIILLIIVLAIAYVQLSYPLRHRPDFEIIQTDVSRFNPSMLLEKYPIVIDDRLVDPHALLRNAFKYQYMWLDEPSAMDIVVFTRPRAKYTILYNASEAKQAVDIIHPKYPIDDTSPVTRVLLNPNQTLVLPPLWAYKSSIVLQRIDLWDVPHWIVSKVM